MSLPQTPPDPAARAPYTNGITQYSRPPPGRPPAPTFQQPPPPSTGNTGSGSESASALNRGGNGTQTAAPQRAVAQKKINNKLCILFTVGLLLLAGGLCLTILAYMRLSNSVLYILGPTIIVIGTVTFTGSILVCISQACSAAPPQSPPTVVSTSQSRLSLTASAVSIPSHSNSQRTSNKSMANPKNPHHHLHHHHHQQHHHQQQQQSNHPFYYNQYLPSENVRGPQFQQPQPLQQQQQHQLQYRNELQQIQYGVKHQQQQQPQFHYSHQAQAQSFKTYYLPQQPYPGNASQGHPRPGNASQGQPHPGNASQPWPLGYPDLVATASGMARKQNYQGTPQYTLGGPFYSAGVVAGMASRSSTLDSRRHSSSSKKHQQAKNSRRRHSQTYAADVLGRQGATATEPVDQRLSGQSTAAEMSNQGDNAITSPMGQRSSSQPTVASVNHSDLLNSDLASSPLQDFSMAQSPCSDVIPSSSHPPSNIATPIVGNENPSPPPSLSLPGEGRITKDMVASDLELDTDMNPEISIDMNLEELLDVAKSKFSLSTSMDEDEVKVKGETIKCIEGISEGVTGDISAGKFVTTVVNTQVTTTV